MLKIIISEIDIITQTLKFISSSVVAGSVAAGSVAARRVALVQCCCEYRQVEAQADPNPTGLVCLKCPCHLHGHLDSLAKLFPINKVR